MEPQATFPSGPFEYRIHSSFSSGACSTHGAIVAIIQSGCFMDWSPKRPAYVRPNCYLLALNYIKTPPRVMMMNYYHHEQPFTINTTPTVGSSGVTQYDQHNPSDPYRTDAGAKCCKKYATQNPSISKYRGVVPVRNTHKEIPTRA